MGLHDPPCDGHAQAGPLGLGGEEGLEEPPLLLRAEPRAAIAHGDAEGAMAVDLRRRAVDRDRDRVAARSEGILEDVAEDLLEAEGIHGAVQVRAVARLPERG